MNRVQQQLLFDVPSAEVRRWMVDPSNENCPFHKFVGNRQALKILGRAAFTALGRTNHVCNDQSFAIIGPASAGKTMLARLFAEVVDLPFVEISPKAISSVNEILEQCAHVLDATNVRNSEGETTLSLVPEGSATNFILPPMVVFIDEVHALAPKIVQGLLKACEHDDSMLVTEMGWTASTKNVCWVIATTDRGKIFDAFDTRFTKINLNLLSMDEVASVVSKKFPEWDESTCKLVAHYGGRVPRECLAFARDALTESTMNPGEWETIVKSVAEDHGIDSFGMTLQRVEALRVLGQQGPTSAENLAVALGIKEEELRKFILPPLQVVTSDQPMPLIKVSSRGFVLSRDGILQLNMRGIPNLGDRALGNAPQMPNLPKIGNN